MNHIFKSIILSFILIISIDTHAQKIKNVIVMIPDGTSTALISASRWYQYYQDSTRKNLTIDHLLCGLVKTHCSNAPIGDSAPTTSCYMTGQPSLSSFVSTYPPQTNQDLLPIDTLRAYQPLATALEGAKILQNKAVGLVFSCEFPHATPADCAAHYYQRSAYDAIAPQIIHNQIDIVIGGGINYLKEQDIEYLKNENYQIFLNDKTGFQKTNAFQFWALFAPNDLPYRIESTDSIPTLAEMTKKAIKTLSKNQNGFFLMVEGSKIDWAAHNNDIKSAITEFLDFDRAVKAAVDYAEKDQETVIIVMPDHGTGGLNIGNHNSNHGYDKISLQKIFQPIDNYSISINTMENRLNTQKPEEIKSLFKTYYNIEITEQEYQTICQAKNYKMSPLSKSERQKNETLNMIIAQILNTRTYFGFTSFGHTGEDVFLGVYHPQNKIPTGLKTNIEMNQYICQQLGIENKLPELTSNIFAPHQEVFKSCTHLQIDSLSQNDYRLTVKHKGNTLVAESYNNYVTVNQEKIPLSSVIVYMPINKTFYLPKNLITFLEKTK